MIDGVKAVIAFDSPRHMISGNWTEVIILDERASADQRHAVETILTGRAGGPWAVLARFVGRLLDTRVLPIEFAEEGPSIRATIPGVLETTLRAVQPSASMPMAR